MFFVIGVNLVCSFTFSSRNAFYTEHLSAPLVCQYDHWRSDPHFTDRATHLYKFSLLFCDRVLDGFVLVLYLQYFVLPLLLNLIYKQSASSWMNHQTPMLLFWQEPAGSDSVWPIQVLEIADIQFFPSLWSSAEVTNQYRRSWESVESALFQNWIWPSSGPCFRADAARTRFTFLLCSWCPGHRQTPLYLLFHLAAGQLCPLRCPSDEDSSWRTTAQGLTKRLLL